MDRPHPLGDPVRHYWLVQGMAHALGIDPVTAIPSQEDWSAMVLTCRSCRDAARCARTLSDPARPLPTKAPDWCKNQRALTALTGSDTHP